jgi:hypothetical protein
VGVAERGQREGELCVVVVEQVEIHASAKDRLGSLTNGLGDGGVVCPVVEPANDSSEGVVVEVCHEVVALPHGRDHGRDPVGDGGLVGVGERTRPFLLAFGHRLLVGEFDEDVPEFLGFLVHRARIGRRGYKNVLPAIAGVSCPDATDVVSGRKTV